MLFKESAHGICEGAPYEGLTTAALDTDFPNGHVFLTWLVESRRSYHHVLFVVVT